MSTDIYQKESVQEILDWARERLKNKEYPTGLFPLNDSTSIFDGKTYLESAVSMIGRNWENPTFHPTISQLWIYREKWENQKDNVHPQKDK